MLWIKAKYIKNINKIIKHKLIKMMNLLKEHVVWK